MFGVMSAFLKAMPEISGKLCEDQDVQQGADDFMAEGVISINSCYTFA